MLFIKLLAGSALGAFAGGVLGYVVAFALGIVSVILKPNDASAFRVAIVAIFTVPLGALLGGIIGAVVGLKQW